MEFHIESMTQDLVERGFREREARAAARRKFGNMTQQSEDARSIWIARWISDLAQDLKYSLRGMRRDAGFTAFVILIAGLGIGASSVTFSIVNALLLRPLPFHDSGRLVWIANQEWSTQVDNFRDFRALNTSFSDLAGWSTDFRQGDSKLTGVGEPERLTSVPVTQNFFSLLGVQPALGRSFTADECQRQFGAPPAALLTHNFWQRRFASDPDILGRKLILNNTPVTVIGVLPSSFDFASVFNPATSVDLFIPWPLTAETNQRGNTMTMVGRLKPGVTVRQAQAEFSVLAKQLEIRHPERNPVKPRLSPLQQHVSGKVRPALLVLACAVGAVMLIVCANLSNLQLARMAARQKEIAVRAALGAGRYRLLRQMLTESLTLSFCGAALGLILALAGARALASLHTFNIPLLGSARIDGGVLGFTLLAAVVTGVLFGLLPALQVQADTLQDTLKANGRGLSAGRRSTWMRGALAVSEIAFACMLLIGAGLLIRSFLRVLDVNLGFQPERAAALRIDPSFQISSAAQQNAFIDDVLHRARSAPGITAAGITDVLPLGGDRSWQVSGKGQIYEKDHSPESFIRVVSDGYFDALGIPLKSGRVLTESDRASSEPVVVVNETLARTLWPGQDPVGQVMTQDGGRRVVGVVGDVHHGGPERSGGSEMYLPMRQTGDYPAMQLVVRTVLPPDSLAAGIRAVLRPIDPNLPVKDFQTLQELVDKGMSPRRFLVILLSGFAGFALLLASLGIYALISYSVSERTKEIGMRMALGASSGLVQRDVLAKTLRLALSGVALGTLGSFALSKGIESLLFGTTTTNPAVFLGVILLLCAVALVAAYAPARRASRIDPMEALRTE
jgi:predicted permease